MCLHNYTTHNGCGHVAESHTRPWTLCDAAMHRLNGLRGPNSPPMSPPISSFAPPKRTSSTRRFFSLSRSNTSASRRTISGPPGPVTPRDSMSSGGSYIATLTLDYATLPDHQLNAVRCTQPMKSTHVSREMDVCKTCKRGLNDMRSMLARYDKTGSVKGTSAFDKFLKSEGDAGGEGEEDVTVPLDDCAGGVALGARQAIIMGHPESAINGSMGLEALEREMNERRGFYS
ncbi:hypothetical protein DE146DRAFT_659740 [Phaeosphaeria sp. MPI-PUGE-AT-0046c]|nr:hypothetical protein DE146DRAFT_659740 [Phaeosphaeria sp. MPI-PUGE-AT-0046c]